MQERTEQTIQAVTIAVGHESVQVRIHETGDGPARELCLSVTNGTHSLAVSVRIDRRLGPLASFEWSPEAHTAREFIRMTRLAQLWALDERWEFRVALGGVVAGFGH